MTVMMLSYCLTDCWVDRLWVSVQNDTDDRA
jgi:hypothetical protein